MTVVVGEVAGLGELGDREDIAGGVVGIAEIIVLGAAVGENPKDCATAEAAGVRIVWRRETGARCRCAMLTKTCIWGRCARPPMRLRTAACRRGSCAPWGRCPPRVQVSCSSSRPPFPPEAAWISETTKIAGFARFS